MFITSIGKFDSYKSAFDGIDGNSDVKVKINKVANYCGYLINNPSLYGFDEDWFPNPFYFFPSINFEDFIKNWPNNLDVPPFVKSNYSYKWLTDYVSFEIPDDGDLFIRAPMGSGKTTGIINAIRNKKGSILVISPRRTITATIHRKFIEAGVSISNYLNGIEIGAERIIISPNSLWKLKKFRKYDYIIIDEIMLFLEYIFSDHPRNKKKMLLIIEKLLVECRKLICSDAFLHPKIIDIFYRWRGHNTFLDFDKKIEKKYIEISEEKFNESIIKEIIVGIKIYIFCETKLRAKKLFGRIKDLCECLLITSETNDKVILLKDPNKTFIKYQCVIASPIILSGFDFNIDWFDKVYGIYSGALLSWNSIRQMSGRIRKCNKIYMVRYGKGRKSRVIDKSWFIKHNDLFHMKLKIVEGKKNKIDKIKIDKCLISDLEIISYCVSLFFR